MEYIVPFVDFGKQYLSMKDEVLAAVDRCFSKGNLILRDDVYCLEKQFANFFDVPYVVGVNSGTDALLLSLLALDVGKGDEVITVSHTHISTVATILQTGAIPKLIDIGDDFNMSVEKIKSALTDKTRAIIPVHLHGRCCNMSVIADIAERYDLKIIEDSAQALGAKYMGKLAGTFGDTGCFSFHPMKTIGANGDGGMIITSDAEVNKKLRLLRNHGMQKEINEHVCFGYNSRLDNVQAAILLVKLKYLKKWIARRREIAVMYSSGLITTKNIILPNKVSETGKYFDTYQNYVITVENKTIRDLLVRHLKDNGIEAMTYISRPINDSPYLQSISCNLPITEKVTSTGVQLPIYPELTDKQIMIVINSILNFFNA